MAYGHAERTLATIRLLEAETRDLLSGLEQLDPEQVQWLRDAAESASRRLPRSRRPPRERVLSQRTVRDGGRTWPA